MIIMRDSFIDGFFSGAERVNRLRSQWNELDDKRAQVDAAEMAREQMQREDQQPRYQPQDERVPVGPQQPRGRVRTEPVDLTPTTPSGPPGAPERRGEVPDYAPQRPSALLPSDSPPPGGVAPRVDDATRARRAMDAWGQTPQDGYNVDGTPVRPTPSAAGGPAPGPADGYDYGGDVPGQTPGRRPWWDWAGRAQDRYSPGYATQPAAPAPAPVRPAAGDLSSWSQRARANYPPPGATPSPGPATRAPSPGEQPTGAPDLSSWSERARTNYPSGRGAPPPAAPEPGQQGADATPTVGSRVLSVLSRLNPIGSAQAATPQRGPVGVSATQPPAEAAPQQPAAQPQAAVVSQAPPVAPGQAGPTAESGPPRSYVRVPFDDRPYSWLAANAREDRALVDRVAQEENVSPNRLALHWHLESGLRHQTPNGRDGERGVMQVLPRTQQEIDPHGKLDPDKVEDSLRMAARYIHTLDRIFGPDTVSSVLAYQSGPGTLARFNHNPQAAIQSNPNGARYLSRAYPGNPQWSREHFPPAIDVDGDQLIRTALQQGPDAFVQLIARSAPGRGIDDGWGAAEAAMVYSALRRGDYQGAQNARELVLHMSQQGATQSLQQAFQALSAGNGQAAAVALARAHAFVPDGMAGQFGVDKAGQVWGRMVDDRDPSKPRGDFFKVTPQDVQRLMIQTRDPNKFVELVQKQQKSAADLRLSEAHAQYYEGADDRSRMASEARSAVGQARLQGQIESAQIRADAQREIAAARNDAGTRRDAQQNDIFKEISTGGNAGGPMYGGESDPERRAALETVHADLRMNNRNITPGAAQAYAQGIISGRYKLIPGQAGTGIIMDPSGTQVGVLSPQALGRIGSVLRPATPAPGRATTGSAALPRATAE